MLGRTKMEKTQCFDVLGDLHIGLKICRYRKEKGLTGDVYFGHRTIVVHRGKIIYVKSYHDDFPDFMDYKKLCFKDFEYQWDRASELLTFFKDMSKQGMDFPWIFCRNSDNYLFEGIAEQKQYFQEKVGNPYIKSIQFNNICTLFEEFEYMGIDYEEVYRMDFLRENFGNEIQHLVLRESSGSFHVPNKEYRIGSFAYEKFEEKITAQSCFLFGDFNFSNLKGLDIQRLYMFVRHDNRLSAAFMISPCEVVLIGGVDF
jgi:hypothetical protein